jgi:hypothetical protein
MGLVLDVRCSSMYASSVTSRVPALSAHCHHTTSACWHLHLAISKPLCISLMVSSGSLACCDDATRTGPSVKRRPTSSAQLSDQASSRRTRHPMDHRDTATEPGAALHRSVWQTTAPPLVPFSPPTDKALRANLVMECSKSHLAKLVVAPHNHIPIWQVMTEV